MKYCYLAIQYTFEEGSNTSHLKSQGDTFGMQSYCLSLVSHVALGTND